MKARLAWLLTWQWTTVTTQLQVPGGLSTPSSTETPTRALRSPPTLTTTRACYLSSRYHCQTQRPSVPKHRDTYAPSEVPSNLQSPNSYVRYIMFTHTSLVSFLFYFFVFLFVVVVVLVANHLFSKNARSLKSILVSKEPITATDKSQKRSKKKWWAYSTQQSRLNHRQVCEGSKNNNSITITVPKLVFVSYEITHPFFSSKFYFTFKVLDCDDNQSTGICKKWKCSGIHAFWIRCPYMFLYRIT